LEINFAGQWVSRSRVDDIWLCEEKRMMKRASFEHNHLAMSHYV